MMAELNNTLLIVEHNNKQLKSETLSLLTAALQLNSEVDAILVGYQCQDIIPELAKLEGIKRLYVADEEKYQHQLAEDITQVVMSIAVNYSAILAAATTTGKNLLPRIAALLDVQQISEVTGVVSSNTFVRPIYAGNALATIQSTDSIKVMTIRTSSFSAAGMGNNNDLETIALDGFPTQNLSQFISEKLSLSTRPDLTSAKIVISGGRGMGSAENFKILEQLADKLGAAVGASRAAVDAGFVGNDLQVGQTGKIVSPELYIAVGISGAIQHLAGMKESRLIIAINNDPDAPIFQISDYGLVADLFEVLAEIDRLL